MMTVILSMIIFALVGAISPGPVNIIATSAGASFGFIRALPHVLGASVAYALIVFLAGSGLNKVFSTLPQIALVLQVCGGLFLLYMSYKIATSVPQTDVSGLPEKAPSFLEGGLTQSLNPKAWLVSMSGVSLFVSSQSAYFGYLMAFTAISLLVCLIGVGTWAVMGHLIGNVLSGSASNNTRYRIYFNRLMALLLCSTVCSAAIAMYVGQ